MSSPAWPPAPLPWKLADGEVHVWSASLAQPAHEVEALLQALSAEEQARAARYLARTARAEFIAARALLRALLAGYLSVPPAVLVFTHGPAGKPLLARPEGSGLHFNVSHSHGLALFAFGVGLEVGVDVEALRPQEGHRDLARRFFSAAEAEALCALPPGQSEEAFFNAWTRKEAFLKATGLGLGYGSERVEVSLLPGEPARLLRIDGREEPAARWSLRELAPAAGYVGALAVAGHGYSLRCWHWPGGGAGG
jgi:4'-phosphopantetheinyl transferase